jgi:protein-tyrosine phosphatase
LNCTATIPNHFADNQNLQYLRLPVHDTATKRDVGRFLRYLPVACEFIYKVRVLEGRPILVHCHAGKQRSAAVVAAFLIRYYGYTPHEAVEMLLRKKPDVFHHGRHVNFAAALNHWYHCAASTVPRCCHACRSVRQESHGPNVAACAA